MRLTKYIAGCGILLGMMTGCTDLNETLYDQVGTENYYNTKSDVVRATFRPFEHAFWSIQSRHVLNELTADQLITPSRDGWWDDGGKWRRYHYHQLNTEDGGDCQSEWNGCFQGIMQCNYVIEDLANLNPSKFGFSQAEFDNLAAQCRTLRAWFYIRLLDAFRNVPLAISFNDISKNSEGQVEPKVIFDFIEKELIDCIDKLVKKDNLGGNGNLQGQWTKAGAAALLVRLYLNANVYVGEERYDDCAAVASKILDGTYGSYEIADRWDAAFDWDNDLCDEVIFGFPADQGYTFWHYQGDTYWWTVPARARYYFGDTKSKAGDHNTKYAASPSYDLTGNLYHYDLGMPVQNFRKYPGDVRMKLYKNLGNSKREGMFIYGYLEYEENGQIKRVKAPERSYELYIRDAVGNFQNLPPERWPTSKTSNLMNGDHNSGWHFAKYPFYSDDDEHQMESDYTEIRLPEVIYSLAECYLRTGKKDEAAKLLNDVRRRNYEEGADLDNILYQPEGKVRLDEKEMLAEWGREFFAESRRRIDLIRFGKFTSGTWWDKTPDADNHFEIFPITRPILNSNPKLVQNPGYTK